MFIDVFLSLLLSFLVNDTEFNPHPAPVFFETTTTGIGYGRPTAECDGTGVCFVSETSFKGVAEDDFGNAIIIFNSSGNVSSLIALSKSMSKNTIQKHFKGSTFIMKDPFIGNLKMGGKSLKIKIPAGNYKIQKHKDGFLLEVSG